MDKKILQNATWIVAGRAIQALLAFVIGLFTARYLGPANYGTINYAVSIVAFLTPIAYLGLNSTLVRELIEHPEQEGTVLGTAIVTSLLSAVVCVVGSACFVAISSPGDRTTFVVCALYSLILLFQSLDLIRLWFQSKLLSKYTALAATMSYLVVSAYKLILLITHKSVYWFALSNVLDSALVGVILLIVYRRLHGDGFHFSRSLAKTMLRGGRFFILSNMMISIFAHTDRVMLKLMLNDSATGFYSAAVTIAGITSILFSSIIDSVRPSILQLRNTDRAKSDRLLSQTYCVIIYLSLAQCIVMTLFARPIVLLLYGRQYVGAVSALRLVVWYTTFSYLGGSRSVWILASQNQKYLWMINLSGALSNVLLNYLLIPRFGIKGAAIASVITQFFTNVVMGELIPAIRENNRLMYRGLDLRLLRGLLRFGRKKRPM